MNTRVLIGMSLLCSLHCGTVSYTNANVTQPVIVGRVARIGGAAVNSNRGGGREFTSGVDSAASAEFGGGVNTGSTAITAGSNAADVGILGALQRNGEKVWVDAFDTGTYVLYLIVWGYGKSYVEANGHVE